MVYFWCSLLSLLILEGACVVPPSKSRYRRSASEGFSSEAMFQRLHQGLAHPFYGSLDHRPGEPTRTHSCGRVRAVPAQLRSGDVIRPDGISTFYSKYTEAYGIPVLSSSNVSNGALKRACYVLRFLLADDAKVRRAFYKIGGRVAIIGKKENTTSIPEHSYLDDWWNERARGLGATWDGPVSSAGEENALCLEEDRYYDDDIVLHEYLHALHNLGLNFAYTNFEKKMKRLYERTKKKGIWDDTYSMSTDMEYFAEAGQSYLNAHAEAVGGNGIHNHVNTRAELRTFDPTIHGLFQRVFSCNNSYLPRCDPAKTRRQQRQDELNQELKMDCSGKPPTRRRKGRRKGHTANSQTLTDQEPQDTTAETSTVITEVELPAEVTTTPCRDVEEYCDWWAEVGECEKSAPFMARLCPWSCGFCTLGED